MAEATDAKDDAKIGEQLRFIAREMAPDGFVLAHFFEVQREWSYATFGPREHRGPKGPLDHLRKEAKEAYDEADPEKQKEEIADYLFLVFDAAHHRNSVTRWTDRVRQPCRLEPAANRARSVSCS
jgi:hypothetical protein